MEWGMGYCNEDLDRVIFKVWVKLECLPKYHPPALKLN